MNTPFKVPFGYRIVTDEDRALYNKPKEAKYYDLYNGLWTTITPVSADCDSFWSPNDVYCVPEKLRLTPRLPDGYRYVTDDEKLMTHKLSTALFWSPSKSRWDTLNVGTLIDGWTGDDIYCIPNGVVLKHIVQEPHSQTLTFRYTYKFCNKWNLQKQEAPVIVATAFNGPIEIIPILCRVTGKECSSSQCPLLKAAIKE